MRTDEYYQLLGISRYATRDAVKRAFRLRLFDSHPDRNPADALASERTRRIIEAYEALNDCAEPAPRKSATPAPEFVFNGPARVIPNWVLKTATAIAVLALMAWLVVAFVRDVFGGPAFVFRPDPAALAGPVEVAAIPTIEQPDMRDCLQWYCAQQYQLSLAGDWAARETIKSYQQAARGAALRKDLASVRFYRSAVARLIHVRSAGATVL